jgi:hypothetical protein
LNILVGVKLNVLYVKLANWVIKVSTDQPIAFKLSVALHAQNASFFKTFFEFFLILCVAMQISIIYACIYAALSQRMLFVPSNLFATSSASV